MPLVDPNLKRMAQQDSHKQTERLVEQPVEPKSKAKPPKGGFFSKFFGTTHTEKSTGAKKKRHESVPVKTTLAFLPFNRIVNEDTIEMTDGVYTDFLQFQMMPLDDSDADDQDIGLRELYQQIMAYRGDVNWIFTSFPIDMRSNLNYLNQRTGLYQPETPLVTEFIDRAKQLLELIQREKQSRDGYLQLFAESPEALAEQRSAILETNRQYIRVGQIPLTKKLQLQFKFFNPLERLPEGELYQDDDYHREDQIQAVVDKKHYDPAYLSQIQPQGGISIEDPNTLNFGNGYLRVLHVYSYKKKNPMFWLGNEFLNLGETVVVSVTPVNLTNRKNDLNRSLSEQGQRQSSNMSEIEKREAQGDYRSLDNLVDSLVNDNEKLFQMHMRIYLAEPSLADLEEKQRTLMTKLNNHGYSAMPFADEIVEEFKAGMTSFTMQNREISRKGQEIRALSLAGSYPFLYSQQVDPTGLYVGQTLGSNGIVALTQFLRDRNRSSYSGWYIGKQGQGKSTAIKLNARNNHLLGNYSILFAVTDEYKKLVESLGGLSIDGRQMTVNFLQIFPMIVNEQTNEVEMSSSYDSSKTKASTIFNLATMVKDGSPVSDLFQTELELFYKEWIQTHHLNFDQITEYPADQYPIATDFKAYVDRRAKEHQGNQDYGTLSQKLQILINDYGSIFNQHTVSDILDYRLIVFNMYSLLRTKNAIYNAQYYNLFSFVYAFALRRGLKQKREYENGQITIDQVQYTDIVSDEFHEVVRANNVTLIKAMDQANREGRKVFLGLHWATQGMDDVFPNFTTKGEDGLSVAVKSLFTLSPYRFIFKTDGSSSEIMHYVFGNEISESDIHQIPKFEEGICVANIAGKTSVKFKWELTEKEKGIFTGGI